ncbi:MAG: thiol reductant ABC exporter subunit CydC [Ancrocorticia sp.]|uniref:thiol reductant ABC exporter subunit CydC n=1 Tax=Ancrocorticia sp. TaxID=2593684 RepID=UPI003F9047F5
MISTIRRAVRLLDISKLGFVLSVLAGSAGLMCSVGLAAVSAWLIAKASQMPPVLDLAVAATTVRALGVGKAVFRYLNQIASHRVALYGMANLRSTVYSTLADSPTDVVTSVRRGDLLARTGRDVDSVGDILVRALQPTTVAVVVSIFSVGLVSWLSPVIGLVVAGGLLISGLVGPLFAMRGARLAEEDQIRDQAELAAQSLAMLESAEELRVSGRLQAMEEATQATEKRIFANRDRAAKPNALAPALDLLGMGITVTLAIIIGTQQVASGALTPIELAVVVLTPLAAFEATQALAKAGVQLVISASAATRIFSLLDRATAERNIPERPADTSQTGLTADDLVIGWPDGRDVAGPLHLHVQQGQSLAIVGPSGIGKTTLLYTLAGMLYPHAGHARLNGQEISYLPRHEVSASLTLTTEDAHLFESSVLENLRVARDSVSETEAEELLTRAGLSSWLAQLPHGVHTSLGSEAATVSGGERRRLLLARALAAPGEYLLIDEPGEHLDPETADNLIRDLLRSGHHPDPAKSRTVVLVTHRLAPLDAADRIVFLSEDSATAGTHEELSDLVPEYRWSVRQEGIVHG